MCLLLVSVLSFFGTLACIATTKSHRRISIHASSSRSNAVHLCNTRKDNEVPALGEAALQRGVSAGPPPAATVHTHCDLLNGYRRSRTRQGFGMCIWDV